MSILYCDRHLLPKLIFVSFYPWIIEFLKKGDHVPGTVFDVCRTRTNFHYFLSTAMQTESFRSFHIRLIWPCCVTCSRWFRWVPTVLPYQFLPNIERQRCVPHQTQQSVRKRKSFTHKVTFGAQRDGHSQSLTISIFHHMRPFVTILVVLIDFHVCIVTTTTTTTTTGRTWRPTWYSQTGIKNKTIYYVNRTHRTVTKERSNTSTNNAYPIRWY